MDHRDDWPNEVLEGGLDSRESLDDQMRESIELIAGDGRRMDAVLAAMANRLSERLSVAEGERAAPLPPRTLWRGRILVPLAAAAIVASLILMRTARTGGSDESLAVQGTPHAPSMTAEMNVEADRPFVVFPTSDPDMAVVWLLNPKESD
ncbi:MAG: hypothetical protein OXR82_12180 [Gammaproteobacteria bacterium]|nr:hypothetical protein [Gammaproteobacteria bacterium]MDE0259127.1 hypothetical protein [Gammaproteobacteria bacterium]